MKDSFIAALRKFLDIIDGLYGRKYNQKGLPIYVLTRLVLIQFIQLRAYQRITIKVNLQEPERYLLAKLSQKISHRLLAKYLVVVKQETLSGWSRRLGSFLHAWRSERAKKKKSVRENREQGGH